MGNLRTNSDILDMTKGPILFPFIRYTLPVVFSGMLTLLFNTVDMVVLGQFVGEIPVAAVGSTTALIGFVTNLFLGISMGATVKIATDIGSGKEDLNRTVQTTYALGTIFGLITCVIGFFLAEDMLRWMNTTEEVFPLAVLYLKIYFLGQPGFMIFSFGKAILSAFGDTKSPLSYLMIAGCINVVLNVFFVIILKQDVVGVAVATVISQYLTAVLITGKLMHLKDGYRLSLRKLILDKMVTKRIMYLGIPSGLQTTLFLMSTVLIQSSVNSLNSTSLVAGNTSAGNIEGFIYTAMISIAQGCLAFSGQNYGARNAARLKKIYKISISLEIAVGVTMGVAAYLCGPELLRLFLPDSAEGILFGMKRLGIIGISYFLCGMMDCTTYMIRGMNQTIVPLVITLTGSVLFRIVWIFTVFPWAAETMNITGAFQVLLVSYPVSWIITFTALLLCYRKTVRSIQFMKDVT